MGNRLLDDATKKYRQLLEEKLRSSVQRLDAPASLKEAMLYSLEAGGKRIRPLLVFAAMDAFDRNPEEGVAAAAAIEMVHTYSLIHDDLPSMDDDDLRRGKPTNHKVFGEAMAILAGDALLTYSFEMIGDMDASPDVKLKLVAGLAKAAGAGGMVGGQAADMEGEDKELTLEELEAIHINKTGRLLTFSVLAGAILSGADQNKLDILSRYAFHLGLAFQIRDDILDLEGDEGTIGKPVGSDTVNHKSTYPRLLTLEGAKDSLAAHIASAREELAKTGLNTRLLLEVTDLVATRNH
ncbi:polyprenyl synthetase family protein [Bacillus sp. FJAT-27445]|uniref:polyprenyl synthetase family protein n=1 Tax=Bacillus sp. FJAT-27445 TaxID=1679166 RepID=UPI0007438E50|nr:farnesyl diphosphate synthase [Bacillus sp. FJAT-27445]